MSPVPAEKLTRAKIKSTIRGLIRSNDLLLRSGRSTLAYRIRKNFGWPSSASPQIQVILLNLQDAGVIKLTDRHGKPVSKSLLTRNDKPAERLIIVPALKAKPAASAPAPMVKAKGDPATAPKSAKVTRPVSPKAMPKRVEIVKPNPDVREILDMMRLELMLTFAGMFEHRSDAIPVIARRLGLKFKGSREVIKAAVELGCDEGLLDVFPRNRKTYMKIMIREEATRPTVEKLRARYGWIANGRLWPPPSRQ